MSKIIPPIPAADVAIMTIYAIAELTISTYVSYVDDLKNQFPFFHRQGSADKFDALVLFNVLKDIEYSAELSNTNKVVRQLNSISEFTRVDSGKSAFRQDTLRVLLMKNLQYKGPVLFRNRAQIVSGLSSKSECKTSAELFSACLVNSSLTQSMAREDSAIRVSQAREMKCR